MSDTDDAGTQKARESLRSSSVPNHYRDLAINGAILAFALGFLYVSGSFTGLTSSRADPGAALWPRVILALIVFSCLINGVSITTRIRADESATSPLPDEFDTAYVAGKIRSLSDGQGRYGFAAFAMFAYLLVLPTVGFLSATPVFLLAFPLIAGYREIPAQVAFSVFVTLLLFVIFRVVLHISLPSGEFFFRDVSIFFEQLFSDLLR